MEVSETELKCLNLTCTFQYDGPKNGTGISETDFENSHATCISQNEGPKTTDHRITSNSRGRKNEIFTNNVSYNSYEANNNDFALVPLSVLRSCLKSNISYVFPQQSAVNSILQSTPISEALGNNHENIISGNGISATKESESKRRQSISMEKLISSSANDVTETTHKNVEKLTKKGNYREGIARREQEKTKKSKKSTVVVSKTMNSNTVRLSNLDEPPLELAHVKPTYVSAAKHHTALVLCKICGDYSSNNHYYYGGRGCASCRAFFRRSVEKGNR